MGPFCSGFGPPASSVGRGSSYLRLVRLKAGEPPHAIAGKSDDGSKVNLLVSYYDVSDTDCPDNTNVGTIVPLNVNVNNLPWGDATFTWERWMHTSNSALTLVDSGSGAGGSFSTSQDMRANVLELYLLAELLRCDMLGECRNQNRIAGPF